LELEIFEEEGDMPHAVVLVAGVLAGVLSLISAVLYVLAVKRGTTTPSLASFGIWLVLCTIVARAYWVGGARWSALVPIVLAVAMWVVVGVALKTGHFSRKWTLLEKLCIAGSVVSLTMWFTTGMPLPTLIWSMVVDFCAAIPTIAKCWKEPHTEDRTAWTISGASQLVNLFAIEHSTDVYKEALLLVYPAVSILMYVLIVTPLWFRPRTFVAAT
jgi:hypothetical protein